MKRRSASVCWKTVRFRRGNGKNYSLQNRAKCQHNTGQVQPGLTTLVGMFCFKYKRNFCLRVRDIGVCGIFRAWDQRAGRSECEK